MLIRSGNIEPTLLQQTRQGTHGGSTDGDQMNVAHLLRPLRDIGIAHICPFLWPGLVFAVILSYNLATLHHSGPPSEGSSMDQQRLKHLLEGALCNDGHITVLTGAGISAESGIPTFRGPEGYWTVGSRVYQPQEMATFRMFQQNPRAVWQWYLYRLGVCRQADPNPGHHALVKMERHFPGRFTLVTQNVDNLHRRCGQSNDNTYEIHGNIQWVRCAKRCLNDLRLLPAEVSVKAKDEPISEAEWQALHCRSCGHLLRPHVLWFDESYDESYYRYESTLKAGRKTDLLFVVGTSGATNLPNQLVAEVYRRGSAIIDINIEENPFGQLADRYEQGMAIRGPSGAALPFIVEEMTTLRTPSS